MKSTEYLETERINFKIIRLNEIPKSAQDVERLYGCPLHHVMKTLVFVGENEPIVAVLPGDKRVDVNKLKGITKQVNLRMAKPEEVEEITGYTIGGVCPFVIEKDTKKVIDKSVFDIKTVNIGSGKAEIGIELNSKDLKIIWDGLIADIIE